MVLLIASAVDLASLDITRDADWVVRGGYLIASTAACAVSIVGGGAELKSHHNALIASFGMGMFVAIIITGSLFVSMMEKDTLSLSVDSALETSFRENEFRIKVGRVVSNFLIFSNKTYF